MFEGAENFFEITGNERGRPLVLLQINEGAQRRVRGAQLR